MKRVGAGDAEKEGKGKVTAADRGVVTSGVSVLLLSSAEKSSQRAVPLNIKTHDDLFGYTYTG